MMSFSDKGTYLKSSRARRHLILAHSHLLTLYNPASFEAVVPV